MMLRAGPWPFEQGSVGPSSRPASVVRCHVAGAPPGGTDASPEGPPTGPTAAAPSTAGRSTRGKAPAGRRPRVAILTNLLAPNRLPLFQRLAEQFEVVVLYSGHEGNREQWRGLERQAREFRVQRIPGLSFSWR